MIHHERQRPEATEKDGHPAPQVAHYPANCRGWNGKRFASVDARRGKGSAKGAANAGRPRASLREFLRTLRDDSPAVRDAITRAASDPDSEAFGHVLRLLSTYDEDGPDQRVQIAEVKARMREQVRVIRELLPPEQSSRLLDALDEVWR